MKYDQNAYNSLIINNRDLGSSPLTFVTFDIELDLKVISRSHDFSYIPLIIDPRDPGPSPLNFVTFDLELDLKVILRSIVFFLVFKHF